MVWKTYVRIEEKFGTVWTIEGITSRLDYNYNKITSTGNSRKGYEQISTYNIGTYLSYSSAW
jgi:hypothetical protein